MGDGGNSRFIKVGPAGKRGISLCAREPWDDFDDGIYPFGSDFVIDKEWDEKGLHRIARISIWHSKHEINSIQFQYTDGTSEAGLVDSERHGIHNGTKSDIVNLDCPSEYISWIRGHTNEFDILCSITFGTSRGQYGPFGEPTTNSKEFNFHVVEGNQFGGFFGFRNGEKLTAIGFYLMKKITPPNA